MIPLRTSIIIHGRTHVVGGDVVHGVMHANVVRVVKAWRNSEKIAQKGSENVIQKAKLSIENRAMSFVMKSQHEGSGKCLEVIDEVTKAQANEGLRRHRLGMLEVK